MYERGISLFKYPHVKDIWTTYLTQVRAAAVCCVCAGLQRSRSKPLQLRRCCGGGSQPARQPILPSLLCLPSAYPSHPPTHPPTHPPIPHPTPPASPPAPQFVARYGGKKVERARDLFRQAIEEAPPEEARPLFLAAAKYEEEHGLARNAMQVRGSSWGQASEGAVRLAGVDG